MSTALGDVYTAFFPPADGRLNFRPDPSCSDTTFIGSATDMGALAAQLLDAALARLDLHPGAGGNEPPRRSLSIVRLGNGEESKAARVVLDLPHDRVVTDHGQAYEVRIDQDRDGDDPRARQGVGERQNRRVPAIPAGSCSGSSTARAGSPGSHRRPACRRTAASSRCT